MLLCQGLTPEHPLVFDGPRTDCWLKCTRADLQTPDSKAWLEEQAHAVRTTFERFLSLAWCAPSRAAAHGRHDVVAEHVCRACKQRYALREDMK